MILFLQFLSCCVYVVDNNLNAAPNDVLLTIRIDNNKFSNINIPVSWRYSQS